MATNVSKSSPKSSKAQMLNFRVPMDVNSSPIAAFLPSLATLEFTVEKEPHNFSVPFKPC